MQLRFWGRPTIGGSVVGEMPAHFGALFGHDRLPAIEASAATLQAVGDVLYVRPFTIGSDRLSRVPTICHETPI